MSVYGLTKRSTSWPSTAPIGVTEGTIVNLQRNDLPKRSQDISKIIQISENQFELKKIKCTINVLSVLYFQLAIATEYQEVNEANLESQIRTLLVS